MCNKNIEICKSVNCEKELVSSFSKQRGFCSTKCKNSNKLTEFLNIKDSYSELRISIPPLSRINETKIISVAKTCRLNGCENIITSRESRTKYCSTKCASESKKKYSKCRNCDNTFHLVKGKKYYCSRTCNLEHIKVDKTCTRIGCGNKIKWKHKGAKYCSSECYNTTKRSSSIIYTNCQHINCNTQLSAKQIRNTQKYCGKSCFLNERAVANKNSIGNISMRKEKKWEYPRRFIKTQTGWILLSTHTWQKNNGPIPIGYFVKLKDNNTFNDQDIENLELRKFNIKLYEDSKKIT